MANSSYFNYVKQLRLFYISMLSSFVLKFISVVFFDELGEFHSICPGHAVYTKWLLLSASVVSG